MMKKPSQESGNHVSVLIVGGGPVGLIMAADLGWRGVNCMLVEQSDGAVDEQKFIDINMRTMEMCRRWGVDKIIREQGFPKDYPHDIIYVTSLTGYLLGHQVLPAHQDYETPPTSAEKIARCPQTIFDPALKALAETFPATTLRYRTRCNSVSPNGAGISAEIEDVASGAKETISADYVVACEGAGSPIRSAVGIEMEGTPVLAYSTNILFESSELLTLHDKGPGYYVAYGPEGRWATLNSMNGKDLWRLQVIGSPEADEQEKTDADECIRRFVGTDFSYQTTSVLYWVRRQMVANHYRMGSTFLAGDSAHQLTPSGGFGLNTGLGDATDLSWMLEAVLAGWGGPHLLDAYEAERRPIGTRNVNDAARRFNRDLEETAEPGPALLEDTAEGETVRADLKGRIQKAIDRNTEATKLGPRYDSSSIQMGYIYNESPIIVSDGTKPPPESEIYIPTAMPGARAPHFWLEQGKSVIDLFGRGFVLLRLGPDAPGAEAITDAARDRGVPLEVHAFDEPELSALYERKLVLVRPDGHVAWRADTLPEDPAALIDQVRGAVPPA